MTNSLLRTLFEAGANRIWRNSPPPLSRPLWIDQPDAAQRASVANVSPETKQVAMDLITKGFSILRGAQDPAICTQAIDDYHRYTRENETYVNQNKDAMGRDLRLVNFHLYSDAVMRLGTNPELMSILDFVFGAEACAYTSLTFKYGTQQPVHRDTPHFATWPENYFCGVWTALEDTPLEAGPLFYHEGAHRFPIDEAEIFEQVKRDNPDMPQREQLDLALDLYNGRVIEEAPNHGPVQIAEMKRGDVAIWHPQMPHGGSPATDQMRSRWCVVFHCAPTNVQVHQHEAFFQNAGREAPPARYRFKECYGRQIARAGDVAYM